MDVSVTVLELTQAQMSIKRSQEGDLGIAHVWTRGRAVLSVLFPSAQTLYRPDIYYPPRTNSSRTLPSLGLMHYVSLSPHHCHLVIQFPSDPQ